MPLGERLAHRLEELGLTQRELARKTGFTQPAISKYIRGETLPGYNAIKALAEVLGVNPNWFFEEREPDKPPPSDELSLHRKTRPFQGSQRSAGGDIVLFPSAGKFTRDATFVIGHFLPMHQVPSPTQVVYEGVVKNFYSLMFNSLVRWIFYGRPRGAIALDWKQREHLWEFQLREGVLFHNGTRLEVADVMESYEHYLTQNPDERRIEGVETVSGSFLRIHLAAPCRLEEVAMPFIVPQGSAGTAAEWIGTGPFQATELTPGFWRLTRNPRYFLSPPYFKEVHIRQYDSPEALEQALVSHEVHFAIGIDAPGRDFMVKAEPDLLRYHLHFMMTEPLVQNRNVRKAIGLALDREALAKAAGLKAPLYSAGPFDYTLGDRAERPAPQDLETARILLEQSEGVREHVFRVKASPTVPQSIALAKAIVEQLNRIGIRAEIGEPPHAQLVVRPMGHLESEYSMWATSDRRNINGYSNPEVDRLIQRFRQSAPTNAELLELRGLIQQDVPDIPLFYYEIPITYFRTLRALENHVIFLSGLNDIHNWYLEEVTDEAGVQDEVAYRATPA